MGCAVSPEAIREALAAEVAPFLRAMCPVDIEEVAAVVSALVEAGNIVGSLRRRDRLAARLTAAAVFEYMTQDQDPGPLPLADFAREAYADADTLIAAGS